MLRLIYFLNPVCSKKRRICPSWHDPPRLHETGRRSNRDGQFVMVRSLHRSGCTAIHSLPRSRPEEAHLDRLARVGGGGPPRLAISRIACEGIWEAVLDMGMGYFHWGVWYMKPNIHDLI